MINQYYNLNLVPNSIPVVVYASQYDVGSRTITFNVYNGGELYTIPSGSAVSVRGTKKDNTGFEYSCNFNGSQVSFNIQDQMTVFSGNIECEIRISKSGQILGSANFILRVENTALKDDISISETDLPLLESAEANALRAVTSANSAANSAALAANSATQVENALVNYIPYVAYKKQNNDTDFNTLLPSAGSSLGFYKVTITSGTSDKNAPETLNYDRSWLVITSTVELPTYAHQIAFYGYSNDDSPRYFVRYRHGSTWQDWKLVILGSDNPTQNPFNYSLQQETRSTSITVPANGTAYILNSMMKITDTNTFTRILGISEYGSDDPNIIYTQFIVSNASPRAQATSRVATVRNLSNSAITTNVHITFLLNKYIG